jgi:CDP-diacylglycerol--glycerol-3-phosphate 3-phosphatidyltransferase
MKKTPQLLIGFRFLLAFLIPLIATLNFHDRKYYLVGLIILGLLSDVFDGIIARKLNVSTDFLRKMDSNVDIVFAFGVLLTSFIVSNEMVRYLTYLYLIVSLELLSYIGFWLKFKKQPSNHSYLTKCFGLLLFINLCLIIGWNSFVLLPLMLVVAILSYIDGFAILIKLKEYKTDNKSFFHLSSEAKPS